MATCAECSPLLLEYLYGLVEEPQAQALRAHLAGCPACQQALDDAKRQQNLFAQAARKYREVPLFQAPTDEPANVPAQSALGQPVPAESTTPATLKMPASGRRSWRRWVPAALAASVLLAAGTLYGGYQQGLEGRQKNLADARRTVEAIDSKLRGLKRDFDLQQAGIAAKVQGQFLHVQLLGPATLLPASATSYRLSTQTPAGQPAPAQVIVKLLDPKADTAKQVLFRQEYKSDGELRFVVPGNLPIQADSEPRLVVEATSGPAREVLEQTLQVEQPSYVTHLAVNKTTLRGGDVLLFRTVTLDRFTLTPIARPLTLDFTLFRNAAAFGSPQLVMQMQGTTAVGGVAGGEFTLVDGSAPLTKGEYLMVASDHGSTKAKPSNVGSASRLLYIEGADQSKLAGAEKTKANPAPKGKQPTPRVTAEFFPEGGDLIAGASSRVYFRLQFPQGTPANLEGVVEDGKQQPILNVQFEGNGQSPGTIRKVALGSFTFTPQFGQLYRFRLSAAGQLLDSYPLPSALPSGVTLTVPRTILDPGQSLQIQVRSDLGQPLLVLASCRGRIVDQKIVPNAENTSAVTLEPQAGTNGVVRVTVYEKDGDAWRPGAERLVYCRPAQYLQFQTAFAGAPATGYRPAGKVTMRIDALNEARKPTPAWLHALVIDERALHPGDSPQASPPAYFMLNTSIRAPEDLEDADFFLADTGAAAKALDLFLGTQGWRRFVKQTAAEPPTLVTRQTEQKAGPPLLFSAGTDKTAILDRFTRAVNEVQDNLANEALHQQFDLYTDRDRAVAMATSAATDLAEFQELPQTLLRHGIGMAVFVLIVVGAGLLLLGIIVALGAKTSPRLWLASSFAVLLLAIILFAGTSPLRTTEDSYSAQTLLNWLKPSNLDIADILIGPNLRGQVPLRAVDLPTVTSKLYAAAAPKATKEALGAKAGKGGGGGKGGGKGGGGFGGAGGGAPKTGLPEGITFSSRAADRDDVFGKGAAAFAQKDGGKAQVQGTFNSQVPGVPNAAQNNVNNKLVNTLRQYAYNRAPEVPEPDGMLFWDPLLITDSGKAQISFDLGATATTYRVIIYGHAADGRLGAYQGTLETKK